MSTGRYYVVTKSGRKFCVEPIAERHQKIEGPVFTNGGISGDGVKVEKSLGGSIRPEDSIITKENGYNRIFTLPAGHSPNGFIEALEACATRVEEDALIAKYQAPL
jgi:hypothetical protein